jgi:hypothetical protein
MNWPDMAVVVGIDSECERTESVRVGGGHSGRSHFLTWRHDTDCSVSLLMSLPDLVDF